MSSPDPALPTVPVAKPPVAVIVGPTAVGKTETSIHAARALGGEIVSADSRLFYRGMDIGTAKPTPAEMDGVPHHLINVADPHETWSLAMFQQAAQQAIAGIHARGRLPIIVGGTGQYVRAVTHGWTPPPAPPNDALRRALENLAAQHNPYWLHEKLNLLDPPAAAAIDPRNLRRTIRALEVIFSTGRRFSDQRSQAQSPYHLITLGLTRPRPELYARIDARIEKMFADGLLDEVRRLQAQGCTPDLPAMSAIGYRECAAVLNNEMTPDEAKTQMKRLTRIFVRRQANWFKETDPDIRWFAMPEQSPEQITAWLRAAVAALGTFDRKSSTFN